MDGANITTTELTGWAALRASIERAAEQMAGDLALDVRFDEEGIAYHRLERCDARLRGMPAHERDWPEWLWERFVEESTLDEHVLLAHRAAFCAAAAIKLDFEGFDCR